MMFIKPILALSLAVLALAAPPIQPRQGGTGNLLDDIEGDVDVILGDVLGPL